MMSSFLRWRPGGYLRASGGLFGWLLVRASAQAVLVLLLARLLGAEGYGFFVAVLAVVGFFAPVAGLGLSGLLLRDGAREPDRLQQRLGMALALWFPAVLVFTFVAVLATAWALPSFIPLPALATFAFAEIASTSFVDLAARVEQSQHHVRTFGALLAGLALARLVGVVAFILLPEPGVLGWMWVYVTASLLYATVVAGKLWMRYRPHWNKRFEWEMVREAFPFTIGAVAYRLQAEFNKPLLAHASYGYAGNFSIAQRVVDLASLPLQALQESLWPRFYGKTRPQQEVWLIAGFQVLLALLCGSLLFIAAPWLPFILGDDFKATANLLAWFAFLPLIQIVRNQLNAILIRSGRQQCLSAAYLIGGGSSIVLNIILIPTYGLTGAICATYLGEIIAAVVLFFYFRQSVINEALS
jgi:O-antigen/teichoic acid export membrane protein